MIIIIIKENQQLHFFADEFVYDLFPFSFLFYELFVLILTPLVLN